MSNYIHYRNFTPNHLARSIVINCSNVRPSWMNQDPYKSNHWPTPASKTYHAVISVPFIRWFFSQEPDKRNILLKAVTRELYHEGGGRIYKRFSPNTEILIKQGLLEFQAAISKRLDNFRYDTRQEPDRMDYNRILSSFSEGERVMVGSRSNVMYDGIFQFDSVINSDYCYIKFDSRPHIVRWEKSLIQKIDISDTSNRRITRQMARTMRLAESSSRPDDNLVHPSSRSESRSEGSFTNPRRGTSREPIVLSDTSEDSSDTDSDIEIQDEAGMGVARAQPPGLFDSSSDENDNSSEDIVDVGTIVDIRDGTSFETLLSILGDGTENRTRVDVQWLYNQGYISNPLKNEVCYVCFEEINENELVYNVKCNGSFRHPLHCNCANQYIEKKHTSCGICKFIWEP